MRTTLRYCTLFNSAYLARGIALYESLESVCDDFHLYVFAFDDLTSGYLKENPRPNLTVIGLNEFEDAELLRVKSGRTSGEYCWTCTPSTILFCINKYGLDHCTYIDADMIFYADPRLLNNELSSDDVLITEHRYTPEYDQSLTSGIYCVQYVLFRNTENGMKVLDWWRNACIDWCYNRLENGKFGDQKYLDDWTSRFDGVHVLQHQGGGVAPWNLQQYDILGGKGRLSILQRSTGIIEPLVFFHFHGLRFYKNEMVEFTGSGYRISETWKRFVFRPYAQRLFQLADEIKFRDPKIAFANGGGHEEGLSRRENGIGVLRSNLLNFIRFLVGRRPAFRKQENHLYHRLEL